MCGCNQLFRIRPMFSILIFDPSVPFPFQTAFAVRFIRITWIVVVSSTDIEYLSESTNFNVKQRLSVSRIYNIDYLDSQAYLRF
jgi:hypothetical protein